MIVGSPKKYIRVVAISKAGLRSSFFEIRLSIECKGIKKQIARIMR